MSAGYGPYRALFDVSFAVPDAGVTALIGSNGAGKSTVARVITGLLASTQGSIRLGGRGRDRTAGLQDRPGRVGPRPRGPRRLRQPDRGGEPAAGVPAAGWTPERLGLAGPGLCRLPGPERPPEAGGRDPVGGEQRILSLAKVLVEPPRLLVADEISLGLAPVMIDAVYEGLRQINGAGTALLIVEQQVDRVLDIATAAVVLEHGSVAYSGPAGGAMAAVEQVLASRGERTQMVSGSADRPKRLDLRWRTATGRRSASGGWAGTATATVTVRSRDRRTHRKGSDRCEQYERDAVIVDVVRTTMGKRGGALSNWHPVDLLGFALTNAGGAHRHRAGHGRRRHRRLRDPGRGAEHQRDPQRMGGRRPPPERAGHHRRPAVRFVAAGHALRRGRGQGRPLRPGGGLRGRDDDPGADGFQRPRAAPGRSRRRSSMPSTAGCGRSSGWRRCWPTGGVSTVRRWTATPSRATAGPRRPGTAATSPRRPSPSP